MRSARALAVIAALLEDHQRMEPHHEDMCRLCRDARSVLTAKPKRSVRAHKSEKAKKDRTKKEKRQDVRAAVMSRAGGYYEHCHSAETNLAPLELDHFLGRARSESLETCWALCRECHRRKTDNEPSAASWLMAFEVFTRVRGYASARDLVVRRLRSIELVREARAALSRGVAE